MSTSMDIEADKKVFPIKRECCLTTLKSYGNTLWILTNTLFEIRLKSDYSQLVG